MVVSVAATIVLLLPMALAGRVNMGHESEDHKPAGKKRVAPKSLLPTIMLDQEFTCVDGEGEADKILKTTDDNSFEACGALCLQTRKCVALDWNFEACRLFKDSVASIGRNQWSRQYCYTTENEPRAPPPRVQSAARVEEEPETQTTSRSPPNTRNRAALERARNAVNRRKDTRHDIEEGVKIHAVESLAEIHQSEAGAPLIADEPVDEAATLLHASFECSIGEGQAWVAYYETKDNSFQGCGALCLNDPACEGFDWNQDEKSGHLNGRILPLWLNDACRLFRSNSPRLGRSLWNRQYCKKIPEKAMLAVLKKKFSCTEKSQGAASQSYNVITAISSFEECGKICEADTACLAFDFSDGKSSHLELHTGKGWKNDACRLYSSHGQTRGEGLSSRTYCKKFVEEAVQEATPIDNATE